MKTGYIKLAGVSAESIVDGIGIRYVLFTQGCKHNCKGCQNPTTHDMKGGMGVRVQDIALDIVNTESIDGVTLSGGDPVYQLEDCLDLCKILKSWRPELNIWCYTGFTIEELMARKDKTTDEFLRTIDVLVDGRFEIDKQTYDKPFVGSSNQRIIDMSKYSNSKDWKIKELEVT